MEDIPNIDEGKQRYDMFVKAYNETREHRGINGLTTSEMYLQRLITSSTYTGTMICLIITVSFLFTTIAIDNCELV